VGVGRGVGLVVGAAVGVEPHGYNRFILIQSEGMIQETIKPGRNHSE